MSLLNDFFGNADRETELGNKLIESLEARYGFHGARRVLQSGDTANMTREEIEWYNEWRPLKDESEAAKIAAEEERRQNIERQSNLDALMDAQSDEFQP